MQNTTSEPILRYCTNCAVAVQSAQCPCQQAWYCSKTCQKTHWKGWHKKECPGKKKTMDQKWAGQMAKLEDPDPAVRVRALQKLIDKKDWAVYLSLVVNKLRDPEASVRAMALTAVAQLDAAQLERYGAAVVDAIRDGYTDVRDAAMLTLKKLHAAGLLAQFLTLVVEQIAAGSESVRQDLGSVLVSTIIL